MTMNSISEEDAELPKDLPWKAREVVSIMSFSSLTSTSRDDSFKQDVDAYAILNESFHLKI